MSDDLISRQETIKFLRDEVSLSTFMKRTISSADKACIDLCERIKNEVPPAQFEVIYCKDCKHWNKSELCEEWDHYIGNEDFYCGCAEREENA